MGKGGETFRSTHTLKRFNNIIINAELKSVTKHRLLDRTGPHCPGAQDEEWMDEVFSNGERVVDGRGFWRRSGRWWKGCPNLGNVCCGAHLKLYCFHSFQLLQSFRRILSQFSFLSSAVSTPPAWKEQSVNSNFVASQMQSYKSTRQPQRNLINMFANFKSRKSAINKILMSNRVVKYWIGHSVHSVGRATHDHLELK